MTKAVHAVRFQPVPWRMFRHEGAARTRLPAWSFVALFLASLILTHLCRQWFGAIAVWPANGVIVAALLLLDRRKAATVFAVSILINLVFDYGVRGREIDRALMFTLLNAAESFAIAVVARRFCGAALEMRRPVRMVRFVLLAAAPAVILAALTGLTLIRVDPAIFAIYFTSWVSVELLGCLLIAPSIIILSQSSPTPAENPAEPIENPWLLLVACGVTAFVCFRIAPLPVVTVLPALLLISLRLSPRQAALAVLLISAIATAAFLTGSSTFEAFGFGNLAEARNASDALNMRLPAFYAFLASVLLTVFPASTFISEKRRLEIRLQRRTLLARQDAARLAVAMRSAEQATEAKRRFLNMISHELRTPLGQVAGFTSLVATDSCLSDDARDKVAKISMANTHALELVDDMIDFARSDITVEPQTFDLRETIVSVLDHVRNSVLRHPLDVRFDNRLTDGAVFVGDPRRLRQLLRLLLHNASKFTEEGEIGITAEASDAGVVLTVFDTGAGFDASRLPELLEAFTQGDTSESRLKEGAGIGLALARRLLVALGGEWSIDTALGRGTRIALTLPMKAAVKPSEVQDAERAPRLLVVDDHPANREILGLMLRAFGCETDYASDGVEAVDAARLGAYDIILMDLRMPRMDGYEASRRIRALPDPIAQAPILAVSAECRAESVGLCRDAGIDGFLAKPVTQAALLETLSTWLDPETARAQSTGWAA